MMRKLSPKRDENGFTLMETMAALLVFSLVTVGLVPLLATSIRGSAIARSNTVGKNLATDSMERVRGLPFFVSYASKNRRVDVLDLYFPNLGSGYSANTFTTTCTSSTVNPACPSRIPPNMTVTFKGTFVRTSTYSSTPVRYDVVTPPAGYRWDSAAGADLPPSQLMELSVRTSWRVTGDTKTYELKTLIGDKKVGTTKVRGTGRVDYAAQVLTGFDVGGVKSSLTWTGPFGESKVETKLLSTASQTASGGFIRLLRSSDDPSVLGTDLTGSPKSGASSSLFAPPDVTPAGATAGARAMAHPDLGSVNMARLDASSTSTLRAAVANELPTATGESRTTTTGTALAGWVNNQADSSTASQFQLENGESLFEIARTTRAMQQETSAVTTATTAADRKVETFSDVKLGDVRALPVKFINGTDDHIIRIADFTARTTCKSTATASTATATGTWTASLRYWRDTTNDGNRNNGSYATVALTSATASAALEGIQTSNPLVLDHADNTQDVYLFEVPGKQGYLHDWGAVAPTATVSADGRVTNVNIDGALRLDVNETDQTIAESVMSIALGKLSCEAIDNR